MNDKNFHKKFIQEISKLINLNLKYNFVDIGANTGLLTKSILKNLNNIENCFLVEPSKDNIFCIKNNLKILKTFIFQILL